VSEPTRALGVAALAALAALGVAVVVRLVVHDPAGLRPDDVVPILLAIAALCVVGLSHRRHPTVAWLAIITALTICTIDFATTMRAAAPTADADGWRWLGIVLCLVALAASAAAIAYATSSPRRLGRWVTVLGGVGLAWLLGVCLWAIADATVPTASAGEVGTSSPLGSFGLVTRSALVALVAFTGLGLLGDARVPAQRVSRRLAVARPAPTTIADRTAYAVAWLAAFADALSPGRSRAHRAALSERSRIARDLHADVVPAVRRALTEAERDGSPERLAVALREILTEVDGMVAAEHAIVLEISGVVAAVEALAERIEERSATRVTIDVIEAAGEPPLDVAVAALRVAGLALENVVRHAPGSMATVTIRAAADRLNLAIEDDGPGVSPAARQAAFATGRRGLADMAAEADGCGAGLVVGPRLDGGVGTRVAFRWPAD
jgi:signal transduction histidine kinase